MSPRTQNLLSLAGLVAALVISALPVGAPSEQRAGAEARVALASPSP